MKLQKGFTLIELMVVIVIIGILSALAIPKMFGVSAKAKASEVPGIFANFEVLQSGYSQETGTAGADAAVIGFGQPGTITSTTLSNTKWFTYLISGGGLTGVLTATVNTPFGACVAAQFMRTTFTAVSDSHVHVVPAAAGCAAYIPNFN